MGNAGPGTVVWSASQHPFTHSPFSCWNIPKPAIRTLRGTPGCASDLASALLPPGTAGGRAETDVVDDDDDGGGVFMLDNDSNSHPGF